MKEIDKTISIHCRELISIILLGLAIKIAPDYLRPPCREALKTASKIAKSNVFVK